MDSGHNLKKISEKISTKLYLKTCALSFDGKDLYLATEDIAENDVFVSQSDGKSWTNAVKLPKNINGKKSNETYASVSNDGKILYFTSDRKGGLGGLDIYKSELDTKGNWGEPVNLGPSVNTAFDEESPVSVLDDKYLVFSSQGHNSIGGFDVFYIELNSGHQAVNLGYPLNTTGDDLGFIPDNSITKGWISKYNEGSLGKADIYYASILPDIMLQADITDTKTNGQVDDPTVQINIIDTRTNTTVKTFNPGQGKSGFNISPGAYQLVVDNENFETFNGSINIPDDYEEANFTYNVLLQPKEKEPEAILAENVGEAIDSMVVHKKPETDVEVTEKAVETGETQLQAQLNTKPEITKGPKLGKDVQVSPKNAPAMEDVEFVPAIQNTGGETYTVQLMALKNPVGVDFFKDLDGVKMMKYPDGYYKYTIGNTSSYDEAKVLRDRLHQKGYTQAFIRTGGKKSNYTIQIMALIVPVETGYFKGLSHVIVEKGNDDFFRYRVGSYTTYEEASTELARLNSMGYTQAFIRK